MPRHRRTLTRALVLAWAAASVATTALAAGPRHPQPAFDRLVSDDPAYGGYEPWVAVNPLNPRNIVEFYQAGLGSRVTAAGQPDTTVPNESDPLRFGPGYPGGHCTLGVSTDGGRTWRRVPSPVNDLAYSFCADPTVVARPDGSFVIVALTGDLFQVVEPRASVSRDGGATWGAPTPVYDKAKTLAQLGERHAYSVTGMPDNDRPWLAVDPSTGHVYASIVGRQDVNGVSTYVGRRYVFSSPDGERWSAPRPLDDADHPGGGTGAIAAAQGRVFAAYLADSSPGTGCPCVIYESSTDEGRTWQRHVVGQAPAATSYTSLSLLAVDPSRPSHAAVALTGSGYGLPADNQTSLLIRSTRDGGRSWAARTVKAARGGQMVKQWMAFAPRSGVLGLGWREVYADNRADFFASFSGDGGRAWSRPVRLNKVTAPPRSRRLVVLDDISHVTLDDHCLYAAWADTRGPGAQAVPQAWFGRYCYSA